MKLRMAMALSALMLLPITAGAGDYEAQGLTIVEPWARATPGGAKVGAAYLEIRAKEGEGDKLVSASSPASETVELHTHVNENGVMKMRRLDALEIKGGGTVKLAPGGDHIMLIGLKEPLKEGEKLPLTLVLEKAGEVKIEAAIAGLGAMAPGGGKPEADGAAGSGSGSGPGSGSGNGSGTGNDN